MRVTLIHNSQAGDGERPVDELVTLIRAAGHDVTCELSKGERWEKALDDPGDLVAVAGGDGSIGAVAGCLFGRRIPIAVLPVGTANNISKTLGVADTPLEHLIAGWTTARRVGFDVGLVKGPWGETRFIEGLGVGLFATAMAQLDAREDVTFGSRDNRDEKLTSALRWLKERLSDCPVTALEITLDGNDLSGEYILVQVMNIQHIGPSLHLAPDADPGDGLLDVVLFTPEDRDKLGEYLANRLDGSSPPLRWKVARGKHLRLRLEGQGMHIDDRVLPGAPANSSEAPTRLDATMIRHALEFLV